MSIPAIAIHGGSGAIPKLLQNPKVKKAYLNALQQALDHSFAMLQNNASALETVAEAVCILEDCPLFNAGKGSVFNAKGEHRMDAAIMEGTLLQAGAITGIQGVKNPVLLAKSVLKDTQYVFLSGDEALKLARKQGIECKPADYFFTQQRYEQWEELKGSEVVKLDHSSNKKFGTVGAVAVDMSGNVAAATSSGGMANKAWGRIGDSSLIGAGTYANNQTCAVSCTGHGEYFIRCVAAYDVSCLMEYKGLSVKEAAGEVINERVKKLGGQGGMIAIDTRGNFALPFNTEGMYRGIRNDQKSMTKIY